MKNTVFYLLCTSMMCIVPNVSAYNYEFKNFTPRVIILEIQLEGGINEQPIRLDIPPFYDGKPGTLSKTVNSILCLSMKAKIAYKYDALKDAFVRGILPASGRTGKQNFEWIMAHPDQFGTFITEITRSGDYKNQTDKVAFTCFDRTFAIFDYQGLWLVTNVF